MNRQEQIRKIYELLFSRDKPSIRVGIALATSQQIDLSSFWQEVTTLIQLSNFTTKGISPTEEEQMDFLMQEGYSIYNYEESLSGVQVLPESIGKFQHWQFLEICYTEIEVLPYSIGQLQQLTKIHAFGNLIQYIPPSIGQLHALIQLELQENQLLSLPKEIGHLQQLRYLDLADNQLTRLPDSITTLKQLEWLDLSNNPITSTRVERLKQHLPNTHIYHHRK